MAKFKLVSALFVFSVLAGCQSAPHQHAQEQPVLDESGNRKLSSEQQFQKELAAEKRECKYGEQKNANGDCERIDSFHRPFRKNGR